jgi:hypothetical protein
MLWMTHSDVARGAHRSSASGGYRHWRSHLALLVVPLAVLLLASCGVSSPGTGHVSARGAATATATPTSAPALPWRRVSFPSGFDPQHWGLDQSPVDGRNLWLCAPAQGDAFTIWASRDAAVTWAPVGHITAATPEPGSCRLIVGQGSATSLAAVITWGSGEAGTLRSISEMSTDGGADWHALPGDMGLQELGTVTGKTYALLHDTANAAALPSGLVVSMDGLRTWQAINPPGLPSNDSIFQFWLGPSASDLAAASIQNTLWRSGDGGATWMRLPTPVTQIPLGAWLPSMGHWLFCGWPGIPTTTKLTCSADQGKSWRQTSLLDYTTQCASCGKGGSPYSDTQTCFPSIIAADGSVLADCPTSGTEPDWAGGMTFTLYRLTPNATTWTSLGAVPAQWLTLSASGQLWCWDPQGGRLFVATLPF